MARIIIDANVLISAAFGGKPFEAVSRAFRVHEIFTSERMIEELEGVAQKLSKKLSPEQVLYVRGRIQQLMGLGTRTEVLTPVLLSRDAKDDHYLSLCKAAQADFLITGDKDLLSIDPENLRKQGISCRIINPTSFLEIVP